MKLRAVSVMWITFSNYGMEHVFVRLEQLGWMDTARTAHNLYSDVLSAKHTTSASDVMNPCITSCKAMPLVVAIMVTLDSESVALIAVTPF